MLRQQHSLTRSIAIAAAMLTLTTAAIIGGTAFFILRNQITDTINISLEHQATDVAQVVENRLNTLSDTLASLAANSLVANALADDEGRKRYLSSFLDGYRTIAGASVSLVLTDYKGRPISTPTGKPVQFDHTWVAERVARNEGTITLYHHNGGAWLLMAEPVIYANTGLPEGALLLLFRLNQLIPQTDEIPQQRMQSQAHLALYFSDPAFTVLHNEIPKPEQSVSLRVPLLLNHIYDRMKIELEVALDPKQFNKPLRQLVSFSSIFVVVVLIIIALLSILLSRTLTRRLRQLEEAAHHVSLETGERERLPISGNDEVTSLAQSFNRLLDNLQRAYDEVKSKSLSLEQALDQAQLARSEAEQANKAKSIFLANMSHELRTPLNAILGFAQLLKRDSKLDEQQSHSITTIHRSGQHLLSLIDDVLEISRIEAGRTELHETPVDLRELLLNVTEVLRLRAQDKGIELSLVTAPDLPDYIEVDQRKLRQMLINLLGNAVKFTDEGWVSLTAKREAESLLFEVADSGPGISPAEQEKIFEPFQQSAGDHRGEGTGLGLTITHEFVHMMGGEISVESHPGEGSRFRIQIPLHRSMTQGEIQPSERQQVVALLPEQPPKRILVVDDRDEGRDLLATLLESAGFQVRTAKDGAEALECFHHWHPHLIWLDMRMPVMDGYEAARRIRQSPGGDETVIIALTASAFEEDHERVMEAGCDHFMRKPVNTDEVFEVMARYLGVRYRYSASRGEEITTTPSTKAIDFSAAMAALPPMLLQKLCSAAAILDVGECRKLIETVADFDPKLGKYLRALADEYRYDELIRICNEE